jgi:hypothetical protein
LRLAGNSRVKVGWRQGQLFHKLTGVIRGPHTRARVEAVIHA